VLFGIVGWWVFLFVLWSVPLAGVILAQALLVGDRRASPRPFGPAEAVTVVILWMGLIAIGLFRVDYVTGYDDEESVLTWIAGDHLLQTSFVLFGGAFWVTVVAWAVLFVLLIVHRVRTRRSAARPTG
jgi:hypothetical protein